MNILKNYVLVIFFATLVSFLAVSNKSIANSDNQEKLYEKRLINAVEARDFTKVKTLLTTALGKKIVQKPIGSKMAGMAIDKGYFKIAHYILAIRNQVPAAKTKIKTLKQNNLIQKQIGGFFGNSPSGIDKKQGKNRDTVNFGKKDKIKNNAKNSPPLSKWPSDKPNPFHPSTIPQIGLPTTGK